MKSNLKNFPVIYGPKDASLQVFQINIRNPLEVNQLLKEIDAWKDALAMEVKARLQEPLIKGIVKGSIQMGQRDVLREILGPFEGTPNNV